MTSETPKFFKKLRNISGLVALIAGTVLAAPVALPAAVVTAAGYLATAAAVSAAVAQSTKKGEEE